MPHISFATDGHSLTVRQSDPLCRGLVWPQRFNVRLLGDTVCEVEINITDTLQVVPLPCKAQYILPNSDGRGYGYLRPATAA